MSSYSRTAKANSQADGTSIPLADPCKSDDTRTFTVPSDLDITVAVPSVPVTVRHRPFTSWDAVKQAGIARANIAPTETHPEGTTEDGYSTRHADQTVSIPVTSAYRADD